MAERAFSKHVSSEEDEVVRSMHLGFNVTPYGLTPTQERTLRALLSVRLHRAQSGTIVTPHQRANCPPTECSIGNKKPRHR